MSAGERAPSPNALRTRRQGGSIQKRRPSGGRGSFKSLDALSKKIDSSDSRASSAVRRTIQSREQKEAEGKGEAAEDNKPAAREKAEAKENKAARERVEAGKRADRKYAEAEASNRASRRGQGAPASSSLFIGTPLDGISEESFRVPGRESVRTAAAYGDMHGDETGQVSSATETNLIIEEEKNAEKFFAEKEATTRRDSGEGAINQEEKDTTKVHSVSLDSVIVLEPAHGSWEEPKEGDKEWLKNKPPFDNDAKVNAFGLALVTTASKDLKDFTSCFGPLLATETPRGEKLHHEGFLSADLNGNYESCFSNK